MTSVVVEYLKRCPHHLDVSLKISSVSLIVLLLHFQLSLLTTHTTYHIHTHVSPPCFTQIQQDMHTNCLLDLSRLSSSLQSIDRSSDMREFIETKKSNTPVPPLPAYIQYGAESGASLVGAFVFICQSSFVSPIRLGRSKSSLMASLLLFLFITLIRHCFLTPACLPCCSMDTIVLSGSPMSSCNVFCSDLLFCVM